MAYICINKVFTSEIHVPTPEIPRRKWTGRVPAKPHPDDRRGPCKPPGPGVHAMGGVRGAPKTIPKRSPAIPPAALFLRLLETRPVSEEVPPKRPSMGLESLRAAKERPSGGRRRSSTPEVSSRRKGNEAASWERSPRHSAGRPRKVSQ